MYSVHVSRSASRRNCARRYSDEVDHSTGNTLEDVWEGEEYQQREDESGNPTINDEMNLEQLIDKQLEARAIAQPRKPSDAEIAAHELTNAE